MNSICSFFKRKSKDLRQIFRDIVDSQRGMQPNEEEMKEMGLTIDVSFPIPFFKKIGRTIENSF